MMVIPHDLDETLHLLSFLVLPYSLFDFRINFQYAKHQFPSSFLTHA